jgi:hypothetical protein
MFDDNYFIGGGTHHHTHRVNVEQHLAPIGEHTKLLNDMRREAMEMVKNHLCCDENSLLNFRSAPDHFRQTLNIFFLLNGKKIYIEVNMLTVNSHQEAIDAVYKAISDRITYEMFMTAMPLDNIIKGDSLQNYLFRAYGNP